MCRFASIRRIFLGENKRFLWYRSSIICHLLESIPNAAAYSSDILERRSARPKWINARNVEPPSLLPISCYNLSIFGQYIRYEFAADICAVHSMYISPIVVKMCETTHGIPLLHTPNVQVAAICFRTKSGYPLNGPGKPLRHFRYLKCWMRDPLLETKFRSFAYMRMKCIGRCQLGRFQSCMQNDK